MSPKRLNHSVSTEESQSSPECLLASQPIRDPYSSDNNAEKKPKKPKRESQINNQKYESEIDEETLQTVFNVKYCAMPTSPSLEQLKPLNMQQVLTELLYFWTNKKDLTASHVVEYVLHDPLSLSSECIQHMFETADFAVNLKECSVFPNIVDTRFCCGIVDRLCRESVSYVAKVLVDSCGRKAFHGNDNSDLVKTCCYHLCRLSGEDIKKDAKLSVKTRHHRGHKSFISKPDITLGGSQNSPIIPFQIYCPLKDCEIGIVSNISTAAQPPPKTKTESCDDSNMDITKLIEKNNPPLICEQPALSDVGHFKGNVRAQHVLQMVSTAVQYTATKALVKQIEFHSKQMDNNDKQIEFHSKKMDNTGKHMDNTSKQMDNNGKQMDNTSKQMDNTIKQINNTSKQMDNTSTQIDDNGKQMDNSSKQMDNTSEQMDNTSKQMDNSNKQMDNSSSGTWEKIQAFIGFFVVNEFIYIGKVVGNEAGFTEYGELVSLAGTPVCLQEKPVCIQFCPVVLDMSIYSHRLAFLFFVKFYLNKWEETKVTLKPT